MRDFDFRDLEVDFWDTILSEKGDPASNSLNAIANSVELNLYQL